MTKREQYGLSFYKIITSNGNIRHLCKTDRTDAYSNLIVIRFLNSIEAQGLIDEITRALAGEFFEPFFTSDGVESEDIDLVYPNVIVNGTSVSMQDMKDLLLEWLSFINS